MPEEDYEAFVTDLAAQQRETDFIEWCDQLVALRADFEPLLEDDIIVHVELHPIRWMNLGFDLLQSRKQSLFETSLPYPIFQMGAEIFLKGMWLCKFDECRDDSYIDVTTRQRFLDELKSKFGHDPLRITDALRKIPQFRDDPSTMRFLKIVEGITRNFYYPLYQADKRRWADCRYPKRFYNDVACTGYADALKRAPHQWLVAELFGRMKRDVERLWDFPLL